MLLSLCLLSFASCGQYAKQSELDDAKERDNAQDDRLSNVEGRVNELEGKVSANTVSIANLSNSLADSVTSIASLREELEQSSADQANALEASIAEATATSNSLTALIEALQGQTTALLAKQAALELEERVVAIYDPCPLVASTGFTESFFLMSSGKYVAYFEEGGKRFLTVLKTGTAYRTTDKRACVFSL